MLAVNCMHFCLYVEVITKNALFNIPPSHTVTASCSMFLFIYETLYRVLFVSLGPLKCPIWS